MAFKQIKPTKQAYAWLATSWDSITGIDYSGFGKRIGLIPNIQRTAAFWKALNVLVGVGTGVDGPSANTSWNGLSVANICRFIEATVLGSGQVPSDPNRQTSNWIQENANALASWVSTYRRALFATDSLDEDYTGNGAVSSIYMPDVWYICMLALSRAFKALGLEYFGTYAGLIYVTQSGDPNFDQSERLRPSLIDNNTALTQARPGGILSRRNLPCWNAGTVDKPNLFGEGFHALNNFYFAGSVNQKARFAEFVCNHILARNAITALGYTIQQVKLAAFLWFSNTEFTNYQMRVTRDVPAGGSITSSNWPGYSFKWQLAITIAAHILGERLFAWDNGQGFSLNANKVPTDASTQGATNSHYTGSGATYADISASDYTAEQAEHAFPLKPLGFDNALPEGARMFQLMSSNTGNAIYNAAPMRKTGETAWSGTGKDQILDALQQKKVWTQLSKGTGANANRRSVFLYSFADTWQSFDIDVDGLIFTRTLAPGTPYCFAFSL